MRSRKRTLNPSRSRKRNLSRKYKKRSTNIPQRLKSNLRRNHKIKSRRLRGGASNSKKKISLENIKDFLEKLNEPNIRTAKDKTFKVLNNNLYVRLKKGTYRTVDKVFNISTGTVDTDVTSEGLKKEKDVKIFQVSGNDGISFLTHEEVIQARKLPAKPGKAGNANATELALPESEQDLPAKPGNANATELALPESERKQAVADAKDAIVTFFETTHFPEGENTTDVIDENLYNFIPTNFYKLEQETETKLKKKLQSEYEKIFSSFSSFSSSDALSNTPKNRYANIYPYNYNRVKLEELPGLAGTDYINASYIDGYNKPNKYIATQGPIYIKHTKPQESTIPDFWKMIWEKNSQIIVMVTGFEEKGRVKCARYFSEVINEKLPYGSFTVTLIKKLDQEGLNGCIKRKFTLKKGEDEDSESRDITHYHFTDWPDHGVPNATTNFNELVTAVRKQYDQDRKAASEEAPMGPITVHCSAGVGRTGTFIAVDYLLDLYDYLETQNDVFNSTDEKRVSLELFKCLVKMRLQRQEVIQTGAQYDFAKNAFIELIKARESDNNSNNGNNGNNGKSIYVNVQSVEDQIKQQIEQQIEHHGILNNINFLSQIESGVCLNGVNLKQNEIIFLIRKSERLNSIFITYKLKTNTTIEGIKLTGTELKNSLRDKLFNIFNKFNISEENNINIVIEKVRIEVRQVVYDFNATESGDLSVEKGEIVEVIERPEENKDWINVKNSDKKEGFVPVTYTEPQEIPIYKLTYTT